MIVIGGNSRLIVTGYSEVRGLCNAPLINHSRASVEAGSSIGALHSSAVKEAGEAIAMTAAARQPAPASAQTSWRQTSRRRAG